MQGRDGVWPFGPACLQSGEIIRTPPPVIRTSQVKILESCEDQSLGRAHTQQTYVQVSLCLSSLITSRLARSLVTWGLQPLVSC